MPAQQQHHVTTAYLSGSTGTVAIGTVLCFTNTATDRFVVATTANLATYGQNPAGIAISSGDDDNIAVELQVVGLVPASITGLGAGSAGDICVNANGVLARGSSPDVVGQCDAEGNAMVNFAGIGVGGSGVSGSNKQLLYINGTTATGETYWTRESAGVIKAAYLDPIDTVTVRAILQIGINSSDHMPLFGAIRVARELSNPGSTTIISYEDGVTGRALLGVSGGIAFLGDTNVANETQIYGSIVTIVGGGTTSGGGFDTSKVVLGSLTGSNGVLSVNSSGSVRRSLGTALQVLRTNAGGTEVEWAAETTTSPGGSDTQFQIKNGSAFDGTANMTYAGGGAVFNASGFASFGTNPATTGPIRLPNNTYIYGRNAGNSANIALIAAGAADDIAVGDLTRSVSLLAGTGKTIAGAADTYSLLTGGGTELLNMTSSLAQFKLAVGVGTSNLATTGNIRIANTGSIVGRNAANSANQYICQLDASNQLWIGSDSAATTSTMVGATRLFGTGSLDFGINGSFVGTWTSSNFTSYTSIQSGGTYSGYLTLSNPFRFKKAAITQSSTADTTLTSTQYECPYLLVSGTPGGNFNVIGPNTADTVFLVSNTTANTMTLKKSGGTGITIATGVTKLCVHDGTDYRST